MTTPRGVLVWVALVIVAGSLDPLPWLPGQPSTAVLAQVVLEPVKPFRVFVVHSYTLENEWTEAQVSGFTQGLAKFGYTVEAGKLEITSFALDSRQLFTTNATLSAIAGVAINKIAKVKPHIVYVTDDAALQQVAVPLLRHPPAGMSLSEFSVVFTGVNGDPTELYPDVFAEDANGDRSYPVTGVLERDDLVSQVKLMQQVKPTLKHIVFISDDSVTSQLSGNRIKSLIPSATAETGVMANTTEDFHMVSTVAQFKDVVLRYNNQTVYAQAEYMFFMLSFWTIRDEHGIGIGSRNDALFQWIVDENRLGELCVQTASAQYGIAVGGSSNGVDSGRRAGLQAALILEGSDAEGLDLQHISVLAVTLNRARIQSTPFLTLPNHLALSANAVYHESKIADDIVTDPPRVLIVHSYSERYYWTVDEQTGFVQGLRRWGYDEGEVQVKVFNMDTKQYFTTVEDKEWIASVAVMYVELFKPKVVLLSDDNALKYFAVPYLEAHFSQENSTNATSFVFTGVNNDPSKLYPHIFPPNGNRTAPICGTMEVTPYVSIVEGMKALKPSLTNIVVVTDDSPTGSGFVSELAPRINEACATTGVSVSLTDIHQIATVAQFQEIVLEANARTNRDQYAIWTYAPWTIKNDDGKAIGTNDLNFINWFLQHNTLGELVEPFFVSKGFLYGGHVDPVALAATSGLMAAQILEGAATAQELRVYNPGVPLTNVNQLRAGQLSQFGITLGMQEMMSADSVFHSTAQGCPPGFGGVSPVCVRCDEGKYKDSFSNSACVRCPDGSYANEHRIACITCPPVGVTCVNGLLEGVPDVWAPSVDQHRHCAESTKFYKCLFVDACQLNESALPLVQTTCAPGYRGPLCSSCEPGFSRSGDYQCSRCPNRGVTTAIAISVAVVVVIGCAVIVKRSIGGRSKAAIGFKMLLSFLQVMMILGSFRNSGTELFKELTGVAVVSSGGASFKSMWMQCALELDYVRQFILYMATPVVAVVVPAVPLLIHKLAFGRGGRQANHADGASGSPSSDSHTLADGSCVSDNPLGRIRMGHSSRSHSSRSRTDTFKSVFSTPARLIAQRPASYTDLYGTSVIVLLFLVYNTVSFEVFVALRCYEHELPYNGGMEELLLADMELKCRGTTLFFAALVFSVVYAVGIPAAAFVLLFRYRHRLHELKMKQRFGFLYDGYLDRPGQRLWFWEQVVNMRKLALIVLSVFFSSQPEVASYWAVIAMIVALALQIHYHPFESHTLNRLETLSISTTIATQFGSILYAIDHKVNPTVVTLFLCLINLFTVGIFCVSIFHMWRIRHKRQRLKNSRKGVAHVEMLPNGAGRMASRSRLPARVSETGEIPGEPSQTFDPPRSDADGVASPAAALSSRGQRVVGMKGLHGSTDTRLAAGSVSGKGSGRHLKRQGEKGDEALPVRRTSVSLRV